MGKKRKQKVRKGKKKPSKSKHRVNKLWQLFKDNKKPRSCPRCGPGFFMAKHKDRYTCGKCGYSEKQVKK
ncbi:MAG: 30S ribosomal protein S27ae [Candidatus Aenigmarchaeota archaeon]|nr:30S ribosomal protein S27ae [Candidatus Aenigmarchaeota archaeon]